MRIRTKSRIAIAALMDVAAHETDRPVTLAGVATRRGTSVSYLEQLFKRLRVHGIVSSTRGPGGGYRLKKQLATVTVTEIIAAVDDDGLDPCNCPVSTTGQVHSLWCRVSHHMYDYLNTVTLASLIEQSSTARAGASRSKAPASRTPTRPAAMPY